MEKENKTRTICMNCLHSVIAPKNDYDPVDTRLVITYSCDKCAAESNDVQFYSFKMRKLKAWFHELIIINALKKK